MRQRRLIDTNLIVRHLVQDHEDHARMAAQLFAACDRGEVTLVVLPAVLAECVFVLESFYKHRRADVARIMATLMNSPGIELDAKAVHLGALARYGATNMHFVDCVIASTAMARGLPVATFDAEFKKIRGVRIDLD